MIDRLSLCNEVLVPWDFARQCAWAAKLGYRGLEVAPYTLAADPATLTEADGRRFAAIAADHGIAISGLHWLLVAPADLSISSPDAAVRRRTDDFIQRMVALCVAMGGAYLVHGSPTQRNPWPGQPVADALARATESWLTAGEAASRLGVTYCIEPLGRAQTQVVNTVDEALAIVTRAGLPGLATMLDTCSAGVTEAEPLPDLIERVWPTGHLAHVQLNDRNKRAPGQGEDRFGPILAALARQSYTGWIAVEPFDYVPDGPGCAAAAWGYLKGMMERDRSQ